MCECLLVYILFRGHERVLSPLELEFQVVLSCRMWVLGPEPTSPGRAAHERYVCAISPALIAHFFSFSLITLNSLV